MRVVLIPSAYAPAVGGVEVLTARLARQLVELGHAVEVWTARSKDDALPRVETIGGVTVRRFVFALPRAAAGSIVSLPKAAVPTLREMRRASRAFRPDVLHVQCFSGNGAYATVLSVLERVPLVVTLQGETLMDDHDIYERSVTLRRALRLGLRRAAFVTGCSSYALGDAVARFGLASGKSRVVFNGVDLAEPTVDGVEVPFDRYVLALGRLVHKKGFDLLLASFAAASTGDVGLVIAGDGPELPNLVALASSHGLEERVHFTGSLSQAAVAGVMRGAELLVVPSRLEPFGIVILEAWRAGLPVIASVHGGAPEFVEEGVTGLLVDPLDRCALAARIEMLVNDESVRRRIAAAGSRAVAAFAWPLVAQQYETIYRAVSSR